MARKDWEEAAKAEGRKLYKGKAAKKAKPKAKPKADSEG